MARRCLDDARALGDVLDVESDDLCSAVSAFEAGPRAQQLLRQLAEAESKIEFSTAYSQCCSAEFIAAHPAEAMGSGEISVGAEPRFSVGFACLVNAIDGVSALPDHALGHPMLGLGPAALPTFISEFIQERCKGPDAAMDSLREHRGEIASWFAVHGALLAAMRTRRLQRALFAASGKNTAMKGGSTPLPPNWLARHPRERRANDQPGSRCKL